MIRQAVEARSLQTGTGPGRLPASETAVGGEGILAELPFQRDRLFPDGNGVLQGEGRLCHGDGQNATENSENGQGDGAGHFGGWSARIGGAIAGRIIGRVAPGVGLPESGFRGRVAPGVFAMSLFLAIRVEHSTHGEDAMWHPAVFDFVIDER